MVTGVSTSAQETRADLTDATREEVLSRAADIVLLFADARGLRQHPRLRGLLVMHLATDEGRRTAARLVIERYGYVSLHPEPFVALKLADESWPTGF